MLLQLTVSTQHVHIFFHKVDLDAIFADFTIDGKGIAGSIFSDLPGERIMNIPRVMPHNIYFLIPIAQLIGTVPSPVRAVEFKDAFVTHIKVNPGKQAVGTRLSLPVMVIELQMACMIFTN